VAEPALPSEPGCRVDLRHPDVSAPAEIAAVLADPTRAGILGLLESGPCCVCEIAAALGERPNNVSNHLARLRDSGLVRAVRHRVDARWVYYERDEAACVNALAALGEVLAPATHPHRATI
jgi:ArsR family transcriptional regulator